MKRILAAALFTATADAFLFQARHNCIVRVRKNTQGEFAFRNHGLLTHPSNHRPFRRCYLHSSPLLMGKPKSGSVVDSYQTVSVNCKKCRTRLFRYKKKNGTKSNLIKCYIERISEDCVDLVSQKKSGKDATASDNDPTDWICPNCDTRFGKDSMIHGRPAIKLVGGKTIMTKK